MVQPWFAIDFQFVEHSVEEPAPADAVDCIDLLFVGVSVDTEAIHSEPRQMPVGQRDTPFPHRQAISCLLPSNNGRMDRSYFMIPDVTGHHPRGDTDWPSHKLDLWDRHAGAFRFEPVREGSGQCR